MTTATPTATPTAAPHATTGRLHIPLLATLTAPLHHGAGNAGNTALLRRQQITLPDGTRARVPFVSGNALRHRLRDALAWHLADTLALPDGSLSKAAVDLLWSGGAITRTGAETDLGLARRVEHVLPCLRLLGYAAGSDITGGTLTVGMLHLVCVENAWRLPPGVTALPQAAQRAGSMQGEEFGTRHDVAGSPVDRLVDAAGLAPATTQMIYEVQVLHPGAVLAGYLELHPAATGAQRAVLAAALELAAPRDADRARRTWLGAKNAVGFGRARLDADLSALPDPGEALVWWSGHLAERREEILALLRELTT